ncbi:predicted protein [Naegleria gruberi]|uniref:Predicted protein n=1 Tax=Naegleria gruberi TaxID=5762 RepID=D2V3C7_NAEGR|nr:uncharacterized protein NAEGRDRAFT_63312 [Naegleria gruberi]EFC48613.1 predicted protein [Naegleria gruberi]|eukprot:XP_002681357.1 predicted protein [Naegleria gruberi strain NEG-M]
MLPFENQYCLKVEINSLDDIIGKNMTLDEVMEENKEWFIRNSILVFFTDFLPIITTPFAKINQIIENLKVLKSDIHKKESCIEFLEHCQVVWGHDKLGNIFRKTALDELVSTVMALFPDYLDPVLLSHMTSI